MIALAGQEQTLLRGHDCGCAVCRCARHCLVFALLVHLKVILLLRLLLVGLPQSQAYVPTKNLLVAGSLLDLGRGSWSCQQPFESTANTHSLCQFLQSQGVFPILTKPTVAQGYQYSYSQHERISVRLLGGFVEEGTKACIGVVVDEVSCL